MIQIRKFKNITIFEEKCLLIQFYKNIQKWNKNRLNTKYLYYKIGEKKHLPVYDLKKK